MLLVLLEAVLNRAHVTMALRLPTASLSLNYLELSLDQNFALFVCFGF